MVAKGWMSTSSPIRAVGWTMASGLRPMRGNWRGGQKYCTIAANAWCTSSTWIADTCGSANPRSATTAVARQSCSKWLFSTRSTSVICPGSASRIVAAPTITSRPSPTMSPPTRVASSASVLCIRRIPPPGLLASYPERGDKRSRKKQECTRNPGTWARATEFAGFRGARQEIPQIASLLSAAKNLGGRAGAS